MGEWSTPRARGPLRARVELPGSKSLTNRALVLAALADGPSRILRPLRARDTDLMADALATLGTRVDTDGPDWTLQPGPLRAGQIDVGLAGTVMRFVPPLAALADGPVHFDGDPYARQRPMATLLDGLRQAGVSIDDGGRGRLPFTVHGRGAVPGGTVRIDASASSQFVSGLLLCAARYDKGIELVHTADKPVPSQPHIEMTMTMLADAGVDVAAPGPGVWQVAPGPVRAREWAIEPDLSNAAPFLAAALVAGGWVTVPRWPDRTTQAGDALRSLLTSMGASVTRSQHGLSVTGRGTIRGVTADLRDAGELVPTIAALAALAQTPSELTGIGHLRGHETDRLAALATELARVGCDVLEQPDSLTIRPGQLHGATWRTYADHRMATAGAILGLAVDGIVVEDVECTSKTLPDFARMWTEMVGS